MDSSIRLYNDKNMPPSSYDDERINHASIPLSEDENSGAEIAYEGDEEALVDLSSAIGAPQEQVQKVDVAEFETIFLRFQAPITNFIYHTIGNREQAADLAQDVFVKAYKALLNGTVVQPTALSAWLYRIAANTTTDTLRRRRLISWLPLSLFNDDRGIGAGVISDSGGNATDGFSANNDDGMGEGRSSSVSALYERGGYDGGRFESHLATREIVERVFQQLPQKYAVCLWLYENDGLSCAEIAEVLTISASAVKMRLMRARERFISLYQKEVSVD
ncbi:MAG: sigma-70 family RNA polymerase sigma factor [Chloroflexi bacterium]|nr:sigma-70 family RNA polymerase sigma factor [Ktedonobacteraceae bacterium]MBV9019854.1 sigma-70 family RNA polymerase sigma factor [Ktedonobacteraceae bacterium]MBV9707268.1 sigma-70 family RNA polymerase sigma factor [Chloroflexota bacterium]